MGSSEPTTSCQAIIALIEVIGEHGIDTAQLEQKTGINCSQMDDPDARITLSQFLKLWQMGIDVTGDPALALHLRTKYRKNQFHFVTLLSNTSANPLEAMQNFLPYAKLVCESDHFEIKSEDDYIIITYSNTSPEHENIWITENHFSSGMHRSRSFMKTPTIPVAVRFRHPDPGYAQEYRETFKCPVFFAQDENQIVFKKKDLLRPFISPDPHLHAVLKKHADTAMKMFSKNESFQDQVRQFITKHLHNGSVDINFVSHAMNMDRSTLLRRLKKEGTTFKDLLSKIRKHLASAYLNQGMTATQISYLLGFSEPSTFQRAFKRWFGKNPGEFRRNPDGMMKWE